jgi:hypothetical protein
MQAVVVFEVDWLGVLGYLVLRLCRFGYAAA